MIEGRLRPAPVQCIESVQGGEPIPTQAALTIAARDRTSRMWASAEDGDQERHERDPGHHRMPKSWKAQREQGTGEECERIIHSTVVSACGTVVGTLASGSSRDCRDRRECQLGRSQPLWFQCA